MLTLLKNTNKPFSMFCLFNFELDSLMLKVSSHIKHLFYSKCVSTKTKNPLGLFCVL